VIEVKFTYTFTPADMAAAQWKARSARGIVPEPSRTKTHDSVEDNLAAADFWGQRHRAA
jgi:hypothetical protein